MKSNSNQINVLRFDLVRFSFCGLKILLVNIKKILKKFVMIGQNINNN